ncbi:MAG: NADH-quinone oxidoreductase subunit K [Deltaproteobacteria bacterium RIFCSPLOWO2_12_FULL_40_28]|nr:MAG: NADH-quinone oxidoreductase subunit K [Deltaproteobacteria bacterium RIFCSPHIGHO2_02_FULL_40_28]OGQ19911.1 MAG: NADH-quinone oxidoreductase subunit K [Deltaproteobacteria bacterium RIFCSPHIGHO2_12_FULL_40_32]OGQ39670.1 MAG: NADH-quinone oxidoreductase subunit K [Deltaproteobacteria bacterium RIFCSPLOWO2_02_FULL_40_36]OGQ52926.1 MAG: NADH-quinone oxidoreductase subunit K [Deltaproteobacteria bacterium RIFCSPLOWO2_12_FULL_40_28]
MITVQHFLALSVILFGLGVLGLVIRKNLLIIFMCIELMLNASNLALVAMARHFGKMDGHVIAFFVMAIAASEAALGLAIVVTLFRSRKTIRTSDWRILRG